MTKTHKCGDETTRSEKEIAERWRDYPTDPSYPRGGRCGTGRCGDCDWCDFLETFTEERVLELLEAEGEVDRLRLELGRAAKA